MTFRTSLAISLLAASLWPVPTGASACAELDKLATTIPAPPFNADRLKLYRKELASITGPDVDLVLLGDSLAEQWNVQMWEPQRVLNFGVGGDGVQHVLWRLSARELKDLKPKNVLIILGTNNLGLAKPCAISFGLGIVFKRVAALWPSTKIAYLEIPPRGQDFNFMNDERTNINVSVRQFPGVKTVNVDDVITCERKQPCENYMDDNLHFSNVGYRVLLRTIEPALFPK
jgi:lysophospholipase L1-like esterase